jgi:O-antigen/teichoic acid export membrane protein
MPTDSGTNHDAEPRVRFAGLRRRFAPQIESFRASDTAKAAGLAGAMIANNVLALISTVVFARLLADYGSLGALISYLLILTVAGQAMQVATAREGVIGRLGVGDGLLETVRRWTRTMLILTAGLTVLSIIFRDQIASAVGVSKYPWGAALGIPAGCLYLEVSLLRGALQGVGDYKSVGLSLIGEQGTRLVTGAVFAIFLGVSGAYLGSLLSYVAMSLWCLMQLRRYASAYHAQHGQAPPHPNVTLWRHVRSAWAPIAALVILAVLQNIDIIAAKHRFSEHDATSYAAVAVAAKVVIWVAIGAGLYLVPEVSRRRAEGEDTRPVLMKALGIILVCAIPCLLIFLGASHLLIKSVFGASKASAYKSLLPLGAAFTVLAGTYLAVQYMLALKRTWFLIPMALVAIAEPILLLNAPREPASFAVVVLAIQAVGAALAFGMALRPDKRAPEPPVGSGRGRDGKLASSETPGTQPPALPRPAVAGSTQRD